MIRVRFASGWVGEEIPMPARRPVVAVFRDLWLILVVGLAAGACDNPGIVSGVTRCAADNSCPNDWVCESTYCFNPALSCLQGVSTPPSGALITDFSDAMPDPNRTGDYRFGSSSGQKGGTVRYASGNPGALSLSNGALTFTATVEAPTSTDMYPYSGFATYMDAPPCIDATSYSGVSFSLTATGTCPIFFAIDDSEHLLPSADLLRGACAGTNSTCYPSQFSVTSSTSTTMVAFNATPTVEGLPTATVDPSKLTSVEWQFSNPSTATTTCSGTITIDNVQFY
jgi:hypothetical protein